MGGTSSGDDDFYGNRGGPGRTIYPPQPETLVPLYSAIDDAEAKLTKLSAARPGWKLIATRRELTEESLQPAITITINPENIGPLLAYSMNFGDDNVSLNRGPGTIGYAVLANNEMDTTAIAKIVTRLETVALADISIKTSLLQAETRVAVPSQASANNLD